MQTLEFPWTVRLCLQDTKRSHRGKGRKGETDGQKETIHSRNAMRKREMKRKRKSYLGNSVRLHRPFSVQHFAYGICLRPSSAEKIMRSLREIALILVRLQNRGISSVLFPFSQIKTWIADKSTLNSTWVNTLAIYIYIYI